MAIKKRKAVTKKAKNKSVRKKIARKKPVQKKRLKVKKTLRKKEEADVIGTVTHYFPQVRAAVVKLKTPLAIGDMIKIKGHTTDFKQAVTSMQIDRVPINPAKKGQEIGLLVDSRVRQHDKVYKAQ